MKYPKPRNIIRCPSRQSVKPVGLLHLSDAKVNSHRETTPN